MRTLELVFPFAVAASAAVAALVWLLVLLDVSGAAAAIALLMIVAGCGLGAAVLGFRRLAPRSLRALDNNGTKFRISQVGIDHLVELAASEVPGVEELASTVHTRSQGLAVECIARIEPRYNPIDVRQRLRGHLKERVPALAGVPVAGVAVRFQGLPNPDWDELP